MEFSERVRQISKTIWQRDIAQRRIEQVVADGLRGQDGDSRKDEREKIKAIVKTTTAHPWSESIGEEICKRIDERGTSD